MTAWPERPAAGTEQCQLPLDGTHEAEFVAWCASPAGDRAMAWMLAKAVSLLNAGNQRIGAKFLVEAARFALRVQINNNATALIARELERRCASLRGRFRHRQRTA